MGRSARDRNAGVDASASSLDRFARRLLRRARIPGLAVGLVRRGRTVRAVGYGFRDRERGLPVTPRTMFGIASITKSFTALAILRLEEEGRLRCDDPVVRHLPGFRTPEPRWSRRTTLHHLLTHSSGLPPLPSIYYTSQRSVRRDPPYDPRVARRVGIDPDHPPIDTYDALIEYLATTRYRPLGPPGRTFSYSNEGFGLLGAVIEEASGRTYEGYVEEAVLRPAGMRETTFDTGILFRSPEVTTLYSPNWRNPHRPLVASEEWWEDSCLRAAGSLRTNLTDLLRYVRVFLEDGRVDGVQVVSAKSLRKMTSPAVPFQPGLYYGYGVVVRPDYHGHRLVFHGGGLKGVASEFVALPDAGVGGAVLANADEAPSPLLLRAGINQLLGLPIDTPFLDVPPPARARRSLAEYAGWYCSGEGIWCRVSAHRDHLTLDFVGIEVTRRGLKLRPAGPDQFVVRVQGSSALVRFERAVGGRIASVFLGWRVVRRRRPGELRLARRGRLVW